ncbi:MAG: cistern family PEP-CTERM protein [Sphingomonadaceae bacterium]|nr:cistern family PEP-CTERM protein [Sphingomonadaceae bacterium]
MRKFTPILAAVSLSFSATPALADAITLDGGDVGTSFSLNFDGFSDGTVIDNLAAVATFTLQAVTGSSYTFAYSITNSTGSPLTSRVSSFAFNTDPTIASASSTGAFSYTTLNSTYPNGIGSVDVCFKDASTGACSGGGSGGLLTGETGTGTFTLNFSQPLSSLTLSDFFVRYQSITGAGNVSSASGSGTLTGSTSGGTQVPEPGMLGLFGAALIGVGLMRRRKKLPLAA